MTDEPKQALERVYVVRLTEGAFDFVRDRRWGVQILDKRCAKFAEEIRSARHEHPDRQAALENMLKAIEAYENRYCLAHAGGFWETNVQPVLDHVRSLEGK